MDYKELSSSHLFFFMTGPYYISYISFILFGPVYK